jgi:hypothetical protein
VKKYGEFQRSSSVEEKTLAESDNIIGDCTADDK